MANSAPDIASETFQTELDDILLGLVQSVNEEAAATIAEALDPTRESHAALLEAAKKTRESVKEAGELTKSLKSSNEKLSVSLEAIETLNTRLNAVVDAFEKRVIEHEKAMQVRLTAIEEAVQSKAVATLTTLVIGGLILFVTVIATQ